jgi:hypothetical protein
VTRRASQANSRIQRSARKRRGVELTLSEEAIAELDRRTAAHRTRIRSRVVEEWLLGR